MLKTEKKTPLWTLGRIEKPARKKEIIGEFLFFIAFFSYCIKYTLDYSGIIGARPEMLNSLCVGFSIMCSMIKISLQRYTPLQFVIIMAVCAMIGYSSLISINYAFLLSFLLVIAMQDIDLEKIVKFGFIAKISAISVHIIWYTFVLHSNPSVIRFNFRAGIGEPRHSFFMGHANNFSAFLLWACFDFIFLNYKKLNAIHIAIIWFINLLFYTFTYTNTSIIVLSITTVLIAIDKFGKGLFDKLLTVLARFSYIFIAAFFTFLTVIYTQIDGVIKELWYLLNSALTGRIWVGAYSYEVFGFTFFGRPFHLYVPEVFFWNNRWMDYFVPFDNYYLGNLYHYGIINLIVVAVAFLLFAGKMENKEKVMVVTLSFFAIMEDYGKNIVICFVLLIIGKYIYAKKVKEINYTEMN